MLKQPGISSAAAWRRQKCARPSHRPPSTHHLDLRAVHPLGLQRPAQHAQLLVQRCVVGVHCGAARAGNGGWAVWEQAGTVRQAKMSARGGQGPLGTGEAEKLIPTRPQLVLQCFGVAVQHAQQGLQLLRGREG